MRQIGAGLSVFMAIFVAWRHLQPEGILFYQGCASSLLATAAQLAYSLSRRRDGTPWKDATITLLAAYAFMFTVPTTIDRAYSVRLLEQLASHPEGMTRTELEQWFAANFATADGVDRRLREQLATGSLAESAGVYHLTHGGQRLTKVFRLLQRVFACGPLSAAAGSREDGR
jgi:hypothetical protein